MFPNYKFTKFSASGIAFISEIFTNFAFKLNIIEMSEDINRIKTVLCDRKKTSKWLAEQLKVSPTTVSKWCTNSSQPDLYTLRSIARLLGVDVRVLLNPTEQAGMVGEPYIFYGIRNE